MGRHYARMRASSAQVQGSIAAPGVADFGFGTVGVPTSFISCSLAFPGGANQWYGRAVDSVNGTVNYTGMGNTSPRGANTPVSGRVYRCAIAWCFNGTQVSDWSVSQTITTP